MFGGFNGSKYYSDFWCFDIVTKEWEEITLSGSVVPRAGHAMIVYLNRFFIIFGGCDNGNFINDIHCIDLEEKRSFVLPVSGSQWSPRFRITSVRFTEEMYYLFGGTTSTGHFCDDIFQLNIECNTERFKPEFVIPKLEKEKSEYSTKKIESLKSDLSLLEQKYLNLELKK